MQDGHNKGQKWYGPNRSRRYSEEVARILRTIQKRSSQPDKHNAVITPLELDILECKVKWASGGGGDGIPVELFQILKDEAVKVLHSICQQMWKTQQGHRTGKDQFSFQSQRKATPKNAQTTIQLHSSHTLVK